MWSKQPFMSPSRIHSGASLFARNLKNCSMASAGERAFRKPWELGSAQVSATGSRAIRYNACMALSFITGIESGLNLPLDFGIYTRRNGSGQYPRRCSDAIAFSLDCRVDQSTWSTPEVRLPLFSVTRFTARALPLNEQVSSRCKHRTLPQRPSRDALTIRACSRVTCRSHRFQSTWSQCSTAAEDAHATYSAFICDFLIGWFCLLSRPS